MSFIDDLMSRISGFGIGGAASNTPASYFSPTLSNGPTTSGGPTGRYSRNSTVPLPSSGGAAAKHIASINALNGVTGPGGGGADWMSMDGIFGYKGADGIQHNGWGGTALGGLQAIGDMYSSMKQFGLAEDQFDEGKRQYDQNYQAQVKNYNTDLEDRQRARVASNSGAYQSVSEYMAKNRQV